MSPLLQAPRLQVAALEVNTDTQAYLPEQRRFYYPGKLGAEARIKERLKLFWKRFAEDPADEPGS